MKIELVRHFEVDHSWNRMNTSQDVIDAANRYNTADIKNTFPINNNYAKVYISEFIRTELTSKFLRVRDQVIKDGLLNELTLNPFIKTKIRLPDFIWIGVWNFCWKMNIPLSDETINQTRKRVIQFLDKIESNNENITIVGHALLFSVMVKELKKRKYHGNYSKSSFKNGEIREYKKIDTCNY